MTTSTSLKPNQEGIDITILPQTYKDAIRVARDLHIRYLWIDAICIIQDSPDDKIEELSRMRYYYENALFVIAASSAKSAQDGFLNFHQNQKCSSAGEVYSGTYPKPAEVPFYSPDGREGSVLLCASPNRYEAINEPLNQRAWTFQERLLCPRVLVFPSTGGFFLQCNSEERHDDTIDFGQPFGRTRLFSSSFLSLWNMPGFDTKSVHKSWLMHIREYSERSITDANDKADAIAGIAEVYHHEFGMQLGNYLAGHWGNHILESLHWRVFPIELKLRPKTIRPPSWSWLSVDSTIQLQPSVMFLKDVVSLVEIHSFGVKKTFPKLPYGKVQAGCLALRAAVGEARWGPPSDRQRLLSLETTEGVRIKGGHAFSDMMENSPVKSTSVFLLPLCTATPSSALLGLVLQQIVPSYKDIFRRIGYFEFAPKTFLSLCREPRLICII